MKFNVKIPIEIDDSDLLQLINEEREQQNLTLYTEVSHIPETQIIEFLKESDYIMKEIVYNTYFEDLELTIMEESDDN